VDSVEVILVHGKFHGPWCWDLVRDSLAAHCHIDAPCLPFTSLRDDAALIRDRVAASKARGRRVILAGHSYAGMVISAGGGEADHLVYVAALAPLAGRTNAQESAESATPVRSRAISVANGAARLDGPSAQDAFYHLCSDGQFAYANARLRECSVEVEDEPVASPAWLNRPATYVICSEDRAVAPAYQRARAALMTDSRVVRADHSVFYSAPGELTAALLGIVN
jgi:hypothetical protein